MMKRRTYILIFFLVGSTLQNGFGQDYYDVNFPTFWIAANINPYSKIDLELNNVKVDYINNVIEVSDERMNPIYGILLLKDGTREVLLKSDTLRKEKLKDYELLTTELVSIDTTIPIWIKLVSKRKKLVPWMGRIVCCLGTCEIWNMENTHFYLKDYIDVYSHKSRKIDDYQPIINVITPLKSRLLKIENKKLRRINISDRTDNQSMSLVKGEKQTSKIITVYPNPTKDKVTVFANNIEQIEVYDTKGSLVKITNPNPSQTETTLNLKFLPKGIYILKIIDNQKQITTSRIMKR